MWVKIWLSDRRRIKSTTLRRTVGCSVFEHVVGFLWDIVMCVALPATVLPPPATAGEIAMWKLLKSPKQLHHTSSQMKMYWPSYFYKFVVLNTVQFTGNAPIVAHLILIKNFSQNRRDLLFLDKLLSNVRYPIQVTYCKSVHNTMMRTHPITHNTSIVAMVCCLWLVATTASRSACSHLVPTKPWWHLQHEEKF